MRRIRRAYTAGEAIGPEIFVFFRAIGVNVKQLYGMTEASVFIAIQKDGDVRLDTVGTPISGGRDQDLPGGGGALPEPGSVPGLLQEPRGHPPDHRGRLGALGGRGLSRPGRAPEDHRPGARREPAGRRDHVRSQVSGEQAEVLAVRQGGGVRRAGPTVRDGADQHRPGRRGELGGAPGRCLHELHGPQPEARGLRPGPGRRRAGQPQSARRRRAARGADPQVPDPAQGARPGRRGDHAHAQGASRVHRPEVRGPHRRALRRGATTSTSRPG